MLSVLDDKLWFPPPEAASADGLLAIGGDLREERLLLAYKNGIFPWFEGSLPLWWNPDPRFVLFPQQVHVSKSMKSIISSNRFQFKTNTSFEEVIYHCKHVQRNHTGTWITNEIESAFLRLYKRGYAHCAEAWQHDELVGGLYGVKLGSVFFGESMFSRIPNASKFAFIRYTQELMSENVKLIDCQVYSRHLESLGAVMISRNNFLDLIKNYIT